MSLKEITTALAAVDAAVMARIAPPFGCELIRAGAAGGPVRDRWRIHDGNDDAIASVAGPEEGYARLIVAAALAGWLRRRRDCRRGARRILACTRLQMPACITYADAARTRVADTRSRASTPQAHSCARCCLCRSRRKAAHPRRPPSRPRPPQSRTARRRRRPRRWQPHEPRCHGESQAARISSGGLYHVTRGGVGGAMLRCCRRCARLRLHYKAQACTARGAGGDITTKGTTVRLAKRQGTE